MTREEAIEKLELLRQKVDEETYRALILAIKALEQESIDCANAEHDADGCLGYSTDRGGYSYCPTCLKCPKASINNRDKEQEPCDDAVSREDAITAIRRAFSWVIPSNPSKEVREILNKCKENLRELPSVTQKSGKWALMYEPKNMVVCSECGKCAYMYQDKTSAFCPHCGAKMQESEDKE